MNPLCKGSFLELHKCPNCGIEYDDQDQVVNIRLDKLARGFRWTGPGRYGPKIYNPDQDYNYHENYGSSSDSYNYGSSSNPSYSSYSSSGSSRRKRAIDDTCDCKLNLKWDEPVKKRFNWGEWEVWSECSKTCDKV